MHLLRMTSYEVEPEYDFTPKIPDFHDAFQKVAKQLEELIPPGNMPGMGVKPDIHEAMAPSTISDNVFGYTVHESSFHKCWTIKETEPNIFGTSEDMDLPDSMLGYKSLLRKGAWVAIKELCLEMNHTVLRSLFLSLADRGLLVNECGNFADVGIISHLISISYILFEEGENDFIEGIHGILMDDGHPCLSRKYYPRMPRLLIAIQVKNIKSQRALDLLKKIQTYRENHNWMDRDKILIKFYDSDGTDKDLIFDEDTGTILWSFGYGDVCHRNACGIGERFLILRKVKTAAAKEHRIFLVCDTKLEINAPTDVGLLVRNNQSLDIYVSAKNHESSIFYGIEIESTGDVTGGTEKHNYCSLKTTYNYCILNKESANSLNERHGVDVKCEKRGRYCVRISPTCDMRIRFYSLGIADPLVHFHYFGLRRESDNTPYVSMTKATMNDASGVYMDTEFIVQFIHAVKHLDNTRSSYKSYMIPCSQYQCEGEEKIGKYEVKSILEEIPVGFGEVPALSIKTRIPVKLLEGNRIVFRTVFSPGAFCGVGEPSSLDIGELKTNGDMIWQFVLHVMKDARHNTYCFQVESLYEYLMYDVGVWAPIPPFTSQEWVGVHPWVRLSEYDDNRGLCLKLSNRDNNQFTLDEKEGTNIEQWVDDKDKRPEIPPFEIVTTDHMEYDENAFLSVFYIKLPSGCLLHGEILPGSTEEVEMISLELPEVSVSTASKPPIVRLGAADCSISDKYQSDGFGCRTIHYEGLTVTAVNGVIKLPIMYGCKDTIRLRINVEDAQLFITILTNLTTSAEPEQEPTPPEENPEDKKEEEGGDTNPDEGGNTGEEDNKGGDTEGDSKDPTSPPHIEEGEDEL